MRVFASEVNGAVGGVKPEVYRAVLLTRKLDIYPSHASEPAEFVPMYIGPFSGFSAFVPVATLTPLTYIAYELALFTKAKCTHENRDKVVPLESATPLIVTVKYPVEIAVPNWKRFTPAAVP
jgi:hypothetical protein